MAQTTAVQKRVLTCRRHTTVYRLRRGARADLVCSTHASAAQLRRGDRAGLRGGLESPLAPIGRVTLHDCPVIIVPHVVVVPTHRIASPEGAIGGRVQHKSNRGIRKCFSKSEMVFHFRKAFFPLFFH